MVQHLQNGLPADSDAADQAWISRFASELSLTGKGPLNGLRFAIKDNIDVLGWPTTVVNRLLNAGASLFGKPNLDRFACGLNGTRSPYGAVPNSFNAAYVSGGSSAGSGRVPAGLNNIVGLKPSKGLISSHGVLPAAQSVDYVSTFARSVGMAVRVLEAAMQADPVVLNRNLRGLYQLRQFAGLRGAVGAQRDTRRRPAAGRAANAAARAGAHCRPGGRPLVGHAAGKLWLLCGAARGHGYFGLGRLAQVPGITASLKEQNA